MPWPRGKSKFVPHWCDFCGGQGARLVRVAMDSGKDKKRIMVHGPSIRICKNCLHSFDPQATEKLSHRLMVATVAAREKFDEREGTISAA